MKVISSTYDKEDKWWKLKDDKRVDHESRHFDMKDSIEINYEIIWFDWRGNVWWQYFPTSFNHVVSGVKVGKSSSCASIESSIYSERDDR